MKWPIGTRIKKVRGEVEIGAIAVVVGWDNDPRGYCMQIICLTAGIVKSTATGECKTHPPGFKCWAVPEHWEPITDSYDKIEWSDCIWQPEHTRMPA